MQQGNFSFFHFIEIVCQIDTIMAQEKGVSAVGSVEALADHVNARNKLFSYLEDVRGSVQTLRTMAHNLPDLPPLEGVRWAQNMLAMHNVVFLELDTTGLYNDAEIIRAVVLDTKGDCILDLYAMPTAGSIRADIERITGITTQELNEKGQSLSEVYEQLRKALLGKYVLAYNLDFDAGKLKEAATRMGIEPIFFTGEDLMARAMRYFALETYPKLSSLCARIGSPLPYTPHQTALHRAKGQLELTRAMATITTEAKVNTAPDIVEDDSDIDEEHPF